MRPGWTMPHRLRSWRAWYAHITLSMLALGLAVVRHPRPGRKKGTSGSEPGMIDYTLPEIPPPADRPRLALPPHPGHACSAWSNWRRKRQYQARACPLPLLPRAAMPSPKAGEDLSARWWGLAARGGAGRGARAALGPRAVAPFGGAWRSRACDGPRSWSGVLHRGHPVVKDALASTSGAEPGARNRGKNRESSPASMATVRPSTCWRRSGRGSRRKAREGGAVAVVVRGNRTGR